MAEPKVVVAHREDLWWILSEACQLEHMIMCQYVVRPLGKELTRRPIGAPDEGHNAGFAFEMHYLMGNFVPWRESAWALLHERMTFLVGRCTAEEPVIRAAGERAAEVADKFAAHVPATLRS